MLYDSSDETKDNEEGERNNPKYGDGSKKKKKMSTSAAPIKNFLDVDKQDIANAKHF